MSAMSWHRFLEPNPHPATVFRDEFDARLFKYPLDSLERALAQELTSFETGNSLR